MEDFRMNKVSKVALIGLSLVLYLSVKAMTHMEQAQARPIRITEVISDRKIDQIVISNSVDGENFFVVHWTSGLSAPGWFSSVWSKEVNILANSAFGRSLREEFLGEEPLIPGARVLDLQITVFFDRVRRYIKEKGFFVSAPPREGEYKSTIISLDDVDEGSYTLHIGEDGTASLQKQKGFFS